MTKPRFKEVGNRIHLLEKLQSDMAKGMSSHRGGELGPLIPLILGSAVMLHCWEAVVGTETAGAGDHLGLTV